MKFYKKLTFKVLFFLAISFLPIFTSIYKAVLMSKNYNSLQRRVLILSDHHWADPLKGKSQYFRILARIINMAKDKNVGVQVETFCLPTEVISDEDEDRIALFIYEKIEKPNPRAAVINLFAGMNLMLSKNLKEEQRKNVDIHNLEFRGINQIFESLAVYFQNQQIKNIEVPLGENDKLRIEQSKKMTFEKFFNGINNLLQDYLKTSTGAIRDIFEEKKKNSDDHIAIVKNKLREEFKLTDEQIDGTKALTFWQIYQKAKDMNKNFGQIMLETMHASEKQEKNLFYHIVETVALKYLEKADAPMYNLVVVGGWHASNLVQDLKRLGYKIEKEIENTKTYLDFYVSPPQWLRYGLAPEKLTEILKKWSNKS
ncbi:hypothetical protein GF322_03690 [Candidatus Dependentiae bacterium]|nr:hypothetical protein [Candidatus Dependentiae bacterium]